MDQTNLKEVSDSGTPNSKSLNKRGATSPLYSEVLLLKKNRQDSANSSISELSESPDSVVGSSAMDETHSNVGDAVHLMSQPMNPLDIIQIATELRSMMLPELKALINGMIPDFKDIVFDAVKDGTGTLKEEIQELKRDNEQLVKTHQDLEKWLTQIESDSDALEQYSRRNTIRISGMPETPSEDTGNVVMHIAQELDVTLNHSDIDRSHRVGKVDENRAGSGKRRVRDIIVKFATYNTRQRLYLKRKDLREREDLKHLFLNEDQTQKRSNLLYDARCLVRAKKLKSAYASDGKIFVRDELEHRHLIKCDNDFSEFGDPKEARKELAGMANLPAPGPAPSTSASASVDSTH